MNEREVVYGLLSMLLPWALVLVIFGAGALGLMPAHAEDVRASPEEVVNNDNVEDTVEPVEQPVEPAEEPVEEPAEDTVEEPVEPVEQPVEPAEEPVEEPAEDTVEEPVEPVTPQTVNDASFLVAGCVLFGVMFLAGLIFSRYVPGGFVRG